MTTNKTPIQELIEIVNRQKTGRSEILFEVLDSIQELMDSFLEKEKAFAFDCYREGYRNAIYYNDIYEGDPDFEKFYSQYAEKHIS